MNMTQLNWLLAYCDVMITLMHPMCMLMCLCVYAFYMRGLAHTNILTISLWLYLMQVKVKKQIPKMMTHNIQDLDFRIFWQFLSVGIEKIKIAPQKT